MPAQSEKQKHAAMMALAYKRGHLQLKDIPAGARATITQMAKMSEESLGHFKHVKPKAKSLLGG